jgi:hypothetical protein
VGGHWHRCSEYLGVDGRKILKMGLHAVGFVDVDWIHLAQGKDQLLYHVNMVIKLRGP